MARLRVKQVLKKKGISQRRFAAMIGVSYHNVFRMIKEDADPKLSTLQKWATLLNVKISSLYTEDRR